MIELKNEYKNLCRLKGYIDLAESERFLRGPLFNEEQPVTEVTAELEAEPEENVAPEPSPSTPIMDETFSL